MFTVFVKCTGRVCFSIMTFLTRNSKPLTMYQVLAKNVLVISMRLGDNLTEVKIKGSRNGPDVYW